MDIYHGLDNIDRHRNMVIALGNFDGVHLGHRELIRRTIAVAENENYTPAVLTFDPHPMKVLQPDRCPPMLLAKEEKIRLLADLGIQLLVIIPFTRKIARLSPRKFVKNILVDRFQVRAVVAGYNYNFGYRGAGNAGVLSQLAEEFGLRAIIVPLVRCGQVEVSSTLIRRLLLEGKVAEAARFLGYFPYLKARVVAGDRRGRQFGFPTANLALPADLLTPANGVYAVKVSVDGRLFKGVANIGVKPTFHLNRPQNLEVHLFEFNGELYKAEIKVEFIQRIRGEQEFSSVPELVRQIENDAGEAKKILDRAGEV